MEMAVGWSRMPVSVCTTLARSASSVRAAVAAGVRPAAGATAALRSGALDEEEDEDDTAAEVGVVAFGRAGIAAFDGATTAEGRTASLEPLPSLASAGGCCCCVGGLLGLDLALPLLSVPSFFLFATPSSSSSSPSLEDDDDEPESSESEEAEADDARRRTFPLRLVVVEGVELAVAAAAAAEFCLSSVT